MAADAYSERALARRTPKVRAQTDQEKAIVQEVRDRVNESFTARKKFIDERKICRDFLTSQWSPEALRTRSRAQEPTVQIHMIEQKVQEVLHLVRQAGIGFRIGSATADTGQDAARAYNGLALRDQRDGMAEAVMERVVFEAAAFGEAWAQWVQVDANSLPVPDEDESPLPLRLPHDLVDKRLTLRAPRQDAVYPDPGDDSPGRDNMGYFIETRIVTLEDRDREFPGAAGLPETSWDGYDGDARWWFPRVGAGATRDRRLRLAYYYRRRYETREYVWAPALGSEWVAADTLTDDDVRRVDEGGVALIRERKRAPVVEHVVTDGRYILSGPTRVPSGVIPFFRVVYQEFATRDGQMLPRGLAWLLKDASSLLSVTLTELAWKQSVAGQDTWKAPAEAIRGHEDMWSDATVKHPIKVYNAYSRTPAADGSPRPLPPPEYETITPAIEGALATAGVARDLLSAVAGSPDPQQRDTAALHRSAQALGAAQEMAAKNNSSIVADIEQQTMRRMGQIWLAEAVTVYDRVGQQIMVSGDEAADPDEGWLVGVPFVRHPDTGELIPVDGVPDEVKAVPADAVLGDSQLAGRTLQVYRFDPRRDKLKVDTYSANLATARKSDKAQFLLQVLQSMPDAAPALLAPIFRAASDLVPLDDVVARVEAMFPDPAPEGQPQDVRGMAAQLQQAGQQLQALQQQVQELQGAADSAQAAREISALGETTKKEIATLKSETDKQIAALRAEVDLRKAGLSSETAAADRASGEVLEGAKLAADAAKPVPSGQGGKE